MEITYKKGDVVIPVNKEDREQMGSGIIIEEEEIYIVKWPQEDFVSRLTLEDIRLLETEDIVHWHYLVPIFSDDFAISFRLRERNFAASIPKHEPHSPIVSGSN